MGTLQKFSCPYCRKTLYISLPLLSSERTCSGCNRVVTIPDKLSEITRGGESTSPARDDPDRQPLLSPATAEDQAKNDLTGAFRLLGWAMIIYLVGIDLYGENTVFQTRIFGDVLVILAMTKFLQLRLQRVFSWIILVLVAFQGIGRVLAMAGVGMVSQDSIVLLAVIVLTYQVVRRVPELNRYRRLLLASIAASVVALALFVVVMVSFGVLLNIHVFLSRLPLLSFLTPLVGILPVFIANFVSILLAAWACFAVANRVETYFNHFGAAVQDGTNSPPSLTPDPS